jgi:DNA polymerase
MNKKPNKAAALAQLHQAYATSPDLLIANGSTNIIFGHGSAEARIVFIGEAPGEQEDRLGEPFVGKSGQLLNKIFEAVGLQRSDVYITNAVKVRPPNNRKPSPQEIERSKELLMKQLAIIKPRIVCTLGSSALHALSNIQQAITKVRGKPFTVGDLVVLPTYHPAYILRNPKELAALYHDIAYAYKYAYPEHT